MRPRRPRSADLLRNRPMPVSAFIPVSSYPDVEKASLRRCDAFGFERRLLVGSRRCNFHIFDAKYLSQVSQRQLQGFIVRRMITGKSDGPLPTGPASRGKFQRAWSFRFSQLPSFLDEHGKIASMGLDQFLCLLLCEPIYRSEIAELICIAWRNAIWMAHITLGAVTFEIENIHTAAHDVLASACGSSPPGDRVAQGMKTGPVRRRGVGRIPVVCCRHMAGRSPHERDRTMPKRHCS